MRFLLKILSNNSRDLHSCVTLSTDKQIFLFNVCDGLQRLGLRNLKFPKLRGIFLSSLGHQSIGGLPGLILTRNNSLSATLPLHKPKSNKKTPASKGLLQTQKNVQKSPEETKEMASVQVFGPYGLTKVLNSMNSLFPFGGLVPHQYKAMSGSLYQSAEQSKSYKSLKDEFTPRTIFKNRKFSKFQNKQIAVHPIQLVNEKSQSILSYIAFTPRPAGKLDLNKAKELGVPQGKLLGKLKSGQSVDIGDGKIVHPEQVLNTPPPAGGVIILNIPSIEYLQSLIANPLLEKYYAKNINSKEQKINAIYYNCHPQILLNTKFHSFLRRFQDSIHLFDCRTPFQVHPRKQAITYLSALKTIFPKLFQQELPTMKAKYGEQNWNGEKKLTEQEIFQIKERLEGLKYQFILDNGLELQIMADSVQIKNYSENLLDLVSKQKERALKQKQRLVQLLTSDQQKYKNAQLTELLGEEKMDVQKNQAKVTFLGTQSMKPGILRNVSAIHLQAPQKSGGILLDCGQNTYGQMLDVWNEQIDQKMRQIRLIYITHAHADHQIGLCRLLSQIQKAWMKTDKNDWTVCVVYPQIMQTYVRTLSSLWLRCKDNFQFIFSHEFDVECGNSYYENAVFNKNPSEYYNPESQYAENQEGSEGKEESKSISKDQDKAPVLSLDEVNEKVKQLYQKSTNQTLSQFRTYANETLGIKNFYVAQNDHMIDSYAGFFEFNNGFKAGYSGDTRPCQNFINYAQGCDLIIHQATFASGLQNEACCKKHSTSDEAIMVKQKSKSKNLILTHFSSRYDKISEVSQNMKRAKVISAFDYMSISSSNMSWAHNMLYVMENIDLNFLMKES